MSFSLAILVNNELPELKKLITLLTTIKSEDDEIVVLQDSNCDIETFNLIKQFLTDNKCVIGTRPLNNNFAAQKNYLNSLCTKEWIVNLDSDELVDDEFLNNLRQLISSNSDIDSIAIPRINTILNASSEFLYAQKTMPTFSFVYNDKGHINFPDYQVRVYKNNNIIKWSGEVHEVLSGTTALAHIPDDYEYEKLFILHSKDVYKQFRQNNKYLTIMEDNRFRLNQYDTLLLSNYNMVDVDFDLIESNATYVITTKNKDYSYESLSEFIINNKGINKIVWITTNYLLYRYLTTISQTNSETLQVYLLDITETYNNSEFYFGIIKFNNVNGVDIYRHHFTLNKDKLNLILQNLFGLQEYNIL